MGHRSYLTEISSPKQWKSIKSFIEKNKDDYYFTYISYVIKLNCDFESFKKDSIVVAWNSDGTVDYKHISKFPNTELIDNLPSEILDNWTENIKNLTDGFGEFLNDNEQVNNYFKNKK